MLQLLPDSRTGANAYKTALSRTGEFEAQSGAVCGQTQAISRLALLSRIFGG